jgi:hypothetical protein
MPASFDDKMQIHKDDGCLTPGGPTGLDPGETALRFDIWIFQKSSGAACMAFQRNLQGERWTMHPTPPNDHFGNRFQPGLAKGVGLIVKRDAKGQIVVEQWGLDITLVA